MNVRTLCLAMLSAGDRSGYDIRKTLSEGAWSHFADASFGSIYPALAKLEADGLVQVREENTPGRPLRKVYSITDEGHGELRESLSQPAPRDVFKSPFLLIALCAEMLDPDDVDRAIDRQLVHMREELKMVQHEVAHNPMQGADWVEKCANHCIGAQIEFLERHRDELVGVAGSGDLATVAEAAE